MVVVGGAGEAGEEMGVLVVTVVEGEVGVGKGAWVGVGRGVWVGRAGEGAERGQGWVEGGQGWVEGGMGHWGHYEEHAVHRMSNKRTGPMDALDSPLGWNGPWTHKSS